MHAPQGNSIVGCVCVSGSISPYSNESAKKTIRSFQHCKNNQVKREGICKTASLQSYKICVKVTSYLSFFLFAFASARAYFNHVALLSTMQAWCCSCWLCHCVMCRNIAHVHILITGCRSLPCGVHLPKGMSYLCSMGLKKVCPQCSAVV